MNKVFLKYGKEELGLEFPTGMDFTQVKPTEAPALEDPKNIVTNALDNPIDQFFIDQFRGVRSAAIAINDKTRPIPYKDLLPPLLSQLGQIGLTNEQVRLIVATGTHTPMSSSEINDILPQDIINNYPISSHNCDDQTNLVPLGKTTQGTSVFVNRLFFESELRIVTGNIEPHHFMGFSGGVKSASIGLAGRETINQNHSMLIHPKAAIGEFSENPMRQDVEEIGKLMGVHYALNTILNGEKKITAALAGNPQRVIEMGILFARKNSQVEVNGLFDLVIASAGGAPKDINLYQSQKALTHAAQIVKPGGVILLLAACPEGSGSASFETFMQDVSNIDDVLVKFKKIGFQVGPHKAFQIARIASRARIILVSELPSELVKHFLMIPAENFSKALQYSLSLVGDHPKIAVLPRATNTIPLVLNQ